MCERRRFSRRTILRWLAGCGAGAAGLTFARHRGFAGGLIVQEATSGRARSGDSTELRQQAREALRKAVRFFVQEVAVEGGYVWRYSADLRFREGEGRASASTVWVQPPGTPAVGDVLLAAYQRTGEEEFLAAAVKAGHCLVQGQLESGGWTYRIEFAPEARRRFYYRMPPRNEKGFNVSTLDDNTTQSALSFLMRLDQALGFSDPAIGECIRYALQRLTAAQYPCGAWPQGFREAPDPAAYPVLPARYPEEVPPAPNFKEYWRFYTLNDYAHMDTIRTFILAADVYKKPEYLATAEKGGQFLLLAQMPDPQPAWAQQYNFQMEPAWARQFEPPAITGHESQEVLRVLMLLYRRTGKKIYLEPIPRALEYLQRSVLPDGRLARFYELKTNRPFYFTRDYRLTYDDADVPRHYAFKVGNDLPSIEREYRRLLSEGPSQPSTPREERPGSASQINTVKRIIASLDDKGRWLESGRISGASEPVNQVIRTETFIRNVDVLSRYLASPLAG